MQSALTAPQARQRLHEASHTLELLGKFECLNGFHSVCQDLALCAAQFTLSLADIALAVGVKCMYGEPSAFKPYQEKLQAVSDFFEEQSKLPVSTVSQAFVTIAMPVISHRASALKNGLRSSHDSLAKCLDHPLADGEDPFDLCEDGIKGCGGFAEVRIGWWRPIYHNHGHSKEQTRVAVKHIRGRNIDSDETSLQERLRKRISHEINSWKAVVGHRHILPFLGFSYSPEPFLVSPWCENGDMRAYLDKNPTADHMQLLIQATDSFNFLHSRQPPIIHQDIKPGNILINSSREAAINDFGLAKIQSNSPTGMTTDKVTMGTLLYMAPELHLDTSAEGGPETDVYAFALLILEVG
ncbi:hypothetical protein FRB94_011477 [Tulasnella sp. JGI-2019a]|nr:hypothetical protein FRB94_011477 [Tulasnella sp. JGI-2019a]